MDAHPTPPSPIEVAAWGAEVSSLRLEFEENARDMGAALEERVGLRSPLLERHPSVSQTFEIPSSAAPPRPWPPGASRG